MIRITSLVVGLVLSLLTPASGQESQPSQIPLQKAQSIALCRSKCEELYIEYKECSEGVAPMHSACELFNQCLHDCD
jgi:hypothetical protein